jgi:hypothetical protein
VLGERPDAGLGPGGQHGRGGGLGQPVGALAVDHTDGPALLGGQVGQALGGGGLARAWEADQQGGQAQLPGRGHHQAPPAPRRQGRGRVERHPEGIGGGNPWDWASRSARRRSRASARTRRRRSWAVHSGRTARSWLGGMVTMATPAGTVTAANPSPRTRIAPRASSTAPAVRVGRQDAAQGGDGTEEAAGGQRGADDEQGQGPGDAARRGQAPPGHPAAPDYPGAGHPTGQCRWGEHEQGQGGQQVPGGHECGGSR